MGNKMALFFEKTGGKLVPVVFSISTVGKQSDVLAYEESESKLSSG